MRLFLAALLILTATIAQARCNGSDLRDHLTASGEAWLQAEVAKVPFAYGNHWIARRGARNVHVVGTMHTGDPRMIAVIRRLRPVIRDADALLLEVTADASEAHIDKLWRTPSAFLREKPPLLPDLLSPEAWAILRDQLAAEDFTAQEVAHMQPWFAGLFLDGSDCGGGLGSHVGLDDRIERIARQARVPVGGLEGAGAGMQALADQPLADQAKMLEWDLSTQLNLDDQVVTMAEAYFGERLAEGLLIQNRTLYTDLDVPRQEVARVLKGFHGRLLDNRNRAWIDVIERTPGDLLVVAVGGAHLPGKAGLLNLLRAQGYTMERAPF